MCSTLLRATEMAQWIPTRWFQSAALRISNDLLIQWKPGLLLALRHQVQGFEAAGCAPAKHLPAFSRGRPVHRRGPGWGGWVAFEENTFLTMTPLLSGKVLVNCQMGMSRSSTCVLAYLILRHQMSADEALNTVSNGISHKPHLVHCEIQIMISYKWRPAAIGGLQHLVQCELQCSNALCGVMHRSHPNTGFYGQADCKIQSGSGLEMPFFWPVRIW